MKRALFVASHQPSLILFRGKLIETFREHGFEVWAAASEEVPEVTQQLGKMQVHYVQLKHLSRQGLNPQADLKLLRELRALYKDCRPEVVFSYTVKPVIYSALAAKRIDTIEVVSLITGLGYYFTSGKSLRKSVMRTVISLLYKVALRRSDVVFFQNSDDHQEFLTRKIISPGQRAAVVNGSGVDLAMFAYTQPDDKPVHFVMIARMLYAKGVLEYMEAARSLKTAYPQVVFSLVGPLEPMSGDAVSQELIEQYTTDGSVQYHGAVRDVRPYLRRCHVFVLPTAYREGVPRTILEALAIGRPVITTDTPGCRTTVEHGINGFLIEPGDTKALTHYMEVYINDQSCILKHAQNSRRLAEKSFDVDNVNDRIWSLIEGNAHARSAVNSR